MSAREYKMSKRSQKSQIDCRVTDCKFYSYGGECTNKNPAITLNKNNKFVCWSKIIKKPIVII